jgi:hypothetical protein
VPAEQNLAVPVVFAGSLGSTCKLAFVKIVGSFIDREQRTNPGIPRFQLSVVRIFLESALLPERKQFRVIFGLVRIGRQVFKALNVGTHDAPPASLV